ncbi:MAG: DUF72 domain-containing protein [Gemmatimonadota bacterium]
MAESAAVRVGVAGWDYPDWKGILYPARKPRGFDPVRFLARFLDVIEINSTFYHPARAEIVQRWARRVEDLQDFRYTAKLWRRFTHERKTAWSLADVKAVTDGFDVLNKAGRLDAVVIHFPWSFRNERSSREWLADLIKTFDQYSLVVEVRHASWNQVEFYEWLRERGVGLVNVDQPLFSKSIKPSVRSTRQTGYVRVHGRNFTDWFRQGAGRDARYNYTYEAHELESWADRAEQIAADHVTDKVEVVFNNHYKAQAVVNAIQFKHLLTGDPQPAPAMLFSHYADALENHAFPVDEANALVI